MIIVSSCFLFIALILLLLFHHTHLQADHVEVGGTNVFLDDGGLLVLHLEVGVDEQVGAGGVAVGADAGGDGEDDTGAETEHVPGATRVLALAVAHLGQGAVGVAEDVGRAVGAGGRLHGAGDVDVEGVAVGNGRRLGTCDVYNYAREERLTGT